MTCNKRPEGGFTVVELLTVIAIMMVITAIATPSFYYWLPTYRLSAGARQVSADLQLARMKAISQNTSFRLRFIAGDKKYQIWKDDGGWSQEPETGDFELPEGIKVINATPFDTSEFQSRGTASGTQTITLEIDGSNPVERMLVCIKTVGRVHIEKPSDGC